jgi:hypothetical protein
MELSLVIKRYISGHHLITTLQKNSIQICQKCDSRTEHCNSHVRMQINVKHKIIKIKAKSKIWTTETNFIINIKILLIFTKIYDLQVGLKFEVI